MSSPEKSSFQQVDGDCGTCDHPLAVHLGPSNTGKCCWDFCTCPGRVAGPLATAADRLWDYCWPLAGDEGAPPKPAFRRALRNVLNGQPPAAVVSSSPATPEGEGCYICRPGNPKAAEEGCDECDRASDAYHAALAAPSPASPAETREGQWVAEQMKRPANVEQYARLDAFFAEVLDRMPGHEDAVHDDEVWMSLALDWIDSLAASPAVSLPGEAWWVNRCPVVVGFVQCYAKAGHDGEHVLHEPPSLPGEQPGGEATFLDKLAKAGEGLEWSKPGDLSRMSIEAFHAGQAPALPGERADEEGQT